MNSLFQDGITVGWLLGESFIVDHGRRSVVPERLADVLLTRDGGISPEEYYHFSHFSDAVMTDQEILELPKVWVVGGDGGMGDIGYQNMSKVILQNRPNVKALMLDTQVYSNTGGQNSDSTPMLGGNDMNMFGTATQGKNTEKKTVAETFLAGHGSPFVAQVSIANAPKLYRAILDGLEYRGTTFLQCFTTCQPEHGVADDMALTQAQRVRDSRGAPEFVFNPASAKPTRKRSTSRATPASISTGTRPSPRPPAKPRATPWPTGAPPKPASATTSRRSSPRRLPSWFTSTTCWFASPSRTWSTAATSSPATAPSSPTSASTSSSKRTARQNSAPSPASWSCSASSGERRGACCNRRPASSTASTSRRRQSSPTSTAASSARKSSSPHAHELISEKLTGAALAKA